MNCHRILWSVVTVAGIIPYVMVFWLVYPLWRTDR